MASRGVRRLTKPGGFLQVSFQWSVDIRPLLKQVKKANRLALRAAGNEVKKEAKGLIKKKRGRRRRNKQGRFIKSKGGSPPGGPPSRVSGNLGSSIKTKVGKTVAWVGATRPRGAHGQILTWGRSPGSRTGRMLPRPFMEPALMNVRARLPAKWANRF